MTLFVTLGQRISNAILRHRLACDDRWTDRRLSYREQESIRLSGDDGRQHKLVDGRHPDRKPAAGARQHCLLLPALEGLDQLAATGRPRNVVV